MDHSVLLFLQLLPLLIVAGVFVSTLRLGSRSLRGQGSAVPARNPSVHPPPPHDS